MIARPSFPAPQVASSAKTVRDQPFEGTNRSADDTGANIMCPLEISRLETRAAPRLVRAADRDDVVIVPISTATGNRNHAAATRTVATICERSMESGSLEWL